jgi:hypothetical protein
MSAVPEDAYRAAWKVIMSGGTLQAAVADMIGEHGDTP